MELVPVKAENVNNDEMDVCMLLDDDDDLRK